jgi:hypothetical protein
MPTSFLPHGHRLVQDGFWLDALLDRSYESISRVKRGVSIFAIWEPLAIGASVQTDQSMLGDLAQERSEPPLVRGLLLYWHR